ncbi:MAG: cellulose biosynthesis cyclic di-GMP-binding regulatory protein BcsB [Elusimicrobia bacterium]|nr:cellulose biosynthesis cyclic di-GMP-binding regulatory protein BcsB [Elusimicrobiota bacterium]
MKKNLISAALAALFLAVFPGAARAEIMRLPLSKFTSARRVDLKCTSADYNVSIPVPDRWKVRKASLAFKFVNSSALLAVNSRLIARFNGDPVSQTGLNPLAPEGSVRFSIPAESFRPGYNDLTFTVNQHYTLGCEYPCQPELWTTLKLDGDDAVMEIEYTLREVPLKLSAVANFLFDPKLTPRGEINLVIPDGNPETLAIASILASGVAMKFDYRNVVFSVSRELAPGYDNILIGSRDFASKTIRGAGFDPAAVKGPYLKLMHLPRPGGPAAGSDPYHALVVLSGLTKDHLKLAAETFAVMSSPFPETNEMTVTGLDMPDIPLYGGKGVIKADSVYTFRSLNFPSRTFAGGNANGAEISFRLPADFLIKQNLYAKLSLSYSYGAANRADSVLNLSLNGQLLRGINLDDPRGGLIEGYKVDIPTYLFKPGNNVLRFDPVLTPLVGKNCEYMQMQNLFLTIMDVSTLEFPPMPHYVDMPRLELFMLNGFPVTRWPDGHGSMFYLANRDRETIETALNLVGMITQKNGHPLLELQYTLTPPEKYKGELVVIGDTGSLPESIKSLSPLALTKEMSFPYPVVQGWADRAQYAFSRQVSGLSAGTGALMEFESPYSEGRSVVLLSAHDPKELLALSVALADPGVQANVKGDLVLIGLANPEKNIMAVAVGKKYFAGKAGLLSRMDVFLYSYPWLYNVLLGLVILVLSLALFYFLQKYRKKRITGV